METIYQGAAYNGLTITSDTPLGDICLFNRTLAEGVSMNIDHTEKAGKHEYACSLTTEETRAMPLGAYDLECFGSDETMVQCIHDFARVLTSSNM